MKEKVHVDSGHHLNPTFSKHKIEKGNNNDDVASLFLGA